MPIIRTTDLHTFDTNDLVSNFHAISPDTQTNYKQKRPYISSSMCQRAIMLNGCLPEREVQVGKGLKYYGAIGNAIESQILETYKAAGQLLIDSWKLPRELFPEGIDLGAKLDALLLYKDEIILVDIKTVGVVEAAAFVSLSPDELRELSGGNQICIVPEDERIKQTALKKMKEVYNTQVQLYAAITGLDNAYIMTVSRRIQDTFSYDGHVSVDYTQIPISEDVLIKRFATLVFGIMARDVKRIPGKLKNIKKGHCNDAFCSHIDFCWNEKPLDEQFDEMSAEEERELKVQALDIANEYISTRSERRELTLSLIEREKQRRLDIEKSISPLRDTAKTIANQYGLYPWEIGVDVKW